MGEDSAPSEMETFAGTMRVPATGWVMNHPLGCGGVGHNAAGGGNSPSRTGGMFGMMGASSGPGYIAPPPTKRASFEVDQDGPDPKDPAWRTMIDADRSGALVWVLPRFTKMSVASKWDAEHPHWNGKGVWAVEDGFYEDADLLKWMPISKQEK